MWSSPRSTAPGARPCGCSRSPGTSPSGGGTRRSGSGCWPRPRTANRAKDHFLAVLCHELRTPLNPILLAATSMLDRPTPPEEFRPTLEMIRQNVNLQARLIDDLLDVMRIVRGKMPLHWEVADCHDLIEQAVQICRSEVLGKNHRPRRSTWPPRTTTSTPTRPGSSRSLEPDQERRQVHARGRHDRRSAPATRAAIGIARHRGRRHRHRHRAGGPARRSSTLPAGRDDRSPASSAGWAWAWRSARASSRPTAARSPPRATARAGGRPSGSPSRRCPSRRTSRLRRQADGEARAAAGRPLTAEHPGRRGRAGDPAADGQAPAGPRATGRRRRARSPTPGRRSRGPTFDLIVSDIGLPDGSGLDLMRKVKAVAGRSRRSP